MPAQPSLSASESSVSVTIRRPLNDHGSMLVEVRGSNEHRHVVAFVDGLREVFTDPPRGTTLPVEMEPLHARGNCWRVTDFGLTDRAAIHVGPRTAERTVEGDATPLATQ